MTAPDKLIDTVKFPIFNPDNERGREFFEASRKTYLEQGALALPGFILTSYVEQMAQESADVEHLSYKQVKHHNVYLAAKDEDHSDDHPRNRQLTTTNSTIADADIQQTALLRSVYGCKELHQLHRICDRKVGHSSLC